MTTTTNIEKLEGELIKTDCLGRIRVNPEHREKLLDAFDGSNMSGQSFAKHCGIKYTTFANWVQKRKRARDQYPVPSSPTPTALLDSLSEVIITPRSTEATSGNAAINVELPGGARFTLTDSSQAQLAAALINNLTR